MNVEYLIQLLNNKQIILNNAKTQAFMSGDLNTINSIDQELLGVQDTLAKLRLLQQISNTAVSTNTTEAQVVANGVSSIQNVGAVPTDPTAVLASYDLSTYAADPLYLQKITDILSVMPILDTAQALDTYINSEAIGSPLNGQMIIAAAQQYSVDVRMLSSILELESNFGTAGLAVRTINPGNVGNTGTSTRTYNSWQDGVAAVALWLHRHTTSSLAAATAAAASSADIVPTFVDSPAFTDSVPVVNPVTPVVTTPVVTPVVPVVPVTPVVPPVNTPATPAATTTAATTTPAVATTTPAVDTATSTAAVASSTININTGNSGTASSTPATTTPPFDISDGGTSSSTPASTATTTPPVNDDATTTIPINIIQPEASTTPSTPVTSTSTQAYNYTSGSKRRRV